MSIVPIQLPPGVLRNGTQYGSRGRWYDTNRVRWHNNTLRAIGGWQRRKDNADDNIAALVTDPSTETVRDCITYRDNLGRGLGVFASNTSLYALTVSGAIVDITPTGGGFTPGSNDIGALTGFGIGPFGASAYGTLRNDQDALPIGVKRWSLDMWGENVLAAYENDGPIYEHTPSGTEALPVSNSPEDLADIVVTSERIVMAIKNSPEIREVIWSDREDNTEWAPAPGNYAGSFKLEGSGRLIGIYKVLNQILILSETDAHVCTYIGAPFVYGFTLIGVQCQPVHSKAVVTAGKFVMWLGSQSFWMYDGALRNIDCEIMDHVIDTLDPNYVSKMWTINIADFGEIWWFYQSKDADEVDSYITYNYVKGYWGFGKLSRTVGSAKGAFRSPIMVDADGQIFNHEQPGVVVDDAYATSGPLELDNGQRNMAVRFIMTDTQSVGDVSVELFSQQLPNDALYSHGVFPFEQLISTTGVLGRNIFMKLTGQQLRWEVGTMRFDVQEIGGGFR